MAIKLAASTRNARLDAIETEVGTGAVLKIRTGSAPADVATADSGSVLVTITLDSDWMAAASSGSKAKAGTWSGTASGTGTAEHFRIYASNGTTQKIQGTVGQGSGDLSLDNTSIASGQTVTVSTFTLTDGNA
jgi:hypothetical protein